MKRNMLWAIGAAVAGGAAALTFWRVNKMKKMKAEKENGFNHKSAPTEPTNKSRIGV